MIYQPGLHIIAEFSSANKELLQQFPAVQQLLNGQIIRYGLQKLGEVYHNFEPAGFTAVICLSESHISLHTWPEFQRVNMDIYLSNYKRANDQTAHAIYEEMQQFFNATIISCQHIKR